MKAASWPSIGICRVYSFTWCCPTQGTVLLLTTSMNAATWWDCHRRAFAYFRFTGASVA
jgi:hypothetical protein